MFVFMFGLVDIIRKGALLCSFNSSPESKCFHPSPADLYAYAVSQMQARLSGVLDWQRKGSFGGISLFPVLPRSVASLESFSLQKLFWAARLRRSDLMEACLYCFHSYCPLGIFWLENCRIDCLFCGRFSSRFFLQAKKLLEGLRCWYGWSFSE